jgi:hypothetical protein
VKLCLLRCAGHQSFCGASIECDECANVFFIVSDYLCNERWITNSHGCLTDSITYLSLLFHVALVIKLYPDLSTSFVVETNHVFNSTNHGIYTITNIIIK